MTSEEITPATSALAEIARGLMRDRSLLLELLEGIHPNALRAEINRDTVRLNMEIGRLDRRIERLTDYLLKKGGTE